MYSLKNLKNFKGHEGEPCVQGTLHGPKGKVADWSDDSWGGPTRIHFIDAAASAAFLAWAKTYLPTVKDFSDKPYDPASMTREDIIETAVSQMSFEAVELAELQKSAKKGIAFYRVDPSVGEGKTLYVSSAAYTATNVAALRAKYKDIVEIVNERFAMSYVDAAVAEKAAENKRFKQLCKSCTLYSLRQDDGTSKIMQMKAPYDGARAAALRAAHGNLAEIINERFL